MRRMRWLAVVALFAVGFGAVYVSTVGLGGTEAATTDFLTQRARVTNVIQSSAATGTVAAAAAYSLAFGEEPQLDGSATATSTQTWTVGDVSVAVGDRVSTGQLLATADTSDLERQLATANQSLDLARITESQAQDTLDGMRSDLKRQLADAKSAVTRAKLALIDARTVRNNAASGSPLRQARIGVNQAIQDLRTAKQTRNDLQTQLKGDFPDQTIALGQAQQSVADLEQQVSDLNDQLNLAQIVAPVDGVVTAINIKPGLVAPSGAAIVLDDATLEVIADVVESDVSSLKVGQTAMVSIDALNLDVPGEVTSIAPSTDATSGNVVTFPVTVTLTDPDPQVRPGMSTNVDITIAEADNALAVPVAALNGSNGNYVVRVLAADGSVQPRSVSVGLVTETWAQILSGVSEGESVIVGTDAARIATDSQSNGFGGPGGFNNFRGLTSGGGRRGGD